MKLSIVTINYNNAEGLRKTLVSVVSQTCKDIEHVIVDGASNDESVSIIKAYAEKAPYQVTWVSEPDKGIYNAMNKGIRFAIEKGVDYIQILNSGDCLYSDTVVADMLQALREKGYPGILYGNMIRDYCKLRNKKKQVRDDGGRQREWTMNDFIRGTINHDPTYINRTLYEKYGLYREDLPITADWRWFVEAVALGGEKPVYVPIDVTLFDTTGISETQIERREKEREEELKRILPLSVYKDYKTNHFPIEQIQRIRRYHLWPMVYFLERILFKFEKWGILRK